MYYCYVQKEIWPLPFVRHASIEVLLGEELLFEHSKIILICSLDHKQSTRTKHKQLLILNIVNIMYNN